MRAPDGLDFLYRPVERGYCKAESLYDGTLSLADVAEMNDAIDLADYNRSKWDEWVRQNRG